jgi:hypothetical protein
MLRACVDFQSSHSLNSHVSGRCVLNSYAYYRVHGAGEVASGALTPSQRLQAAQSVGFLTLNLVQLLHAFCEFA